LRTVIILDRADGTALPSGILIKQLTAKQVDTAAMLIH
jgi:hypothetical protein